MTNEEMQQNDGVFLEQEARSSARIDTLEKSVALADVRHTLSKDGCEAMKGGPERRKYSRSAIKSPR